MKTLNLLLAFIFLAVFSFAQQVPRDKVVVEIGTGTWCYYCPGAALGADDLVSNGKEVAVVEYHGGGVDNYINEYSAARIGYYGITGYPTAYFDGGNAVVGGNHTNSMYSTYLPIYNQRINIPSSFSINMIGSKIGTHDYQVTVTTDKVAEASTANLVLHFVLTESDIVYNWQGLTGLDFVERLMFPNQMGTAMDFSSSSEHQINFTFSLDPTWVSSHCEVIAFIQNTATKEIFQGAKRSLSEFEATNNLDAAIVNTSIPKAVCMNSFIPKVKIGNYGTDNLTSLDIITQINNEPSITYNWSGNLAFMASEIIELPQANFTIQSSNTCLVTLDNPNGQTDQYLSNNSKTVTMDLADEVTPPIGLIIQLDNNPQETSWELKNLQGDLLYSGGPYSQPNQFIMQSFNLADNGLLLLCYL